LPREKQGRIIGMVNKVMALYIAAGVATTIAGVMHLMLAPGNLRLNVNLGILFTVGGIAQIFWLIPMIRRWGRGWYAVGITGTIAFMAIFFVTRMPGNPITGRGGPASNPIAITIEFFQGIFVALAAAILIYEAKIKKQRMTKNKPKEPIQKKPSKKVLPILAGVVIALILAGLFVLPMTMPRPMGGRLPGQNAGNSPGNGQFAGPSGLQEPPPSISSQSGNNGNDQVLKTALALQNCTLTPSLIEVEDTPQQIEGPYFVDEKLNRSDIRSNPEDGSMQEGIPLTLILHVYGIAGNNISPACTPIKGAQVDIWHANSQGLYSDIQSIGTAGQKFLRGYQLTDENGMVRFTTIYPGWYQGRAIHIHVKVRTFEGPQSTSEWTSQLYLDNSINSQVHTQAPYSKHSPVQITNEQDGIYSGPSTDSLVQSNAGKHLMLNLNKEGTGYVGTFNIGLGVSKPS